MAVYFVRQGLTGNVKIGFAADIAKRISSLQTGQAIRLKLMRLVEGDRATERSLHKRFGLLSIGGEWFRFHPDMLGDIDLPDIEMPALGKYRKDNWPDNPWTYEGQLHRELLQIVGGEEGFSRRFGMRPWRITNRTSTVQKVWWSAFLILLWERGRTDITFAMLEAARQASDEATAKRDAADRRKEEVNFEAMWIKRNPGIAPWWEVSEENKALLHPPALEIVASNEAAA